MRNEEGAKSHDPEWLAKQVCYGCGETGHLAADCPNKEKKKGHKAECGSLQARCQQIGKACAEALFNKGAFEGRVKDLSELDAEGADKLLQLDLNLGFEQRTVFAGIKSAYDPATLVGRQVVVVANLAARKMRFGTSQGMVLAAGPGGEDIWLLSPDSGAVPGMRVR